MSNLANYSPFNRSYQFMHLQNSAYHLRNKQKAKPRVNTNLSHSLQRTQPLPTHKLDPSRTGSTRARCESARSSPSGELANKLKQPHRVIHKNQAFERAKSARISHENMKIVRKIIKTDCQVIKKSTAEAHFQMHQKYRSLRKRYQENGERFTTPILNFRHLNPFLIQYSKSRLSSARYELSKQEDSYQRLPLQWLE